MASQQQLYEGPKTPRREGVTLRGKVVLDGSSVPLTTTAQDKRRNTRWVCTRTGVGTYRWTLDDKYAGFNGIDIQVQGSVVAASGCEYFIAAETVATTRLVDVTFRRTDTGAAADPPASSTLHVRIYLDDVTLD